MKLADLKRVAKELGVIVEAERGCDRETPGIIRITAPEHKCFEPGLHEVITVQNKEAKLEAWETTIKSAMVDLRAHAALLQDCPEDCECRD